MLIILLGEALMLENLEMEVIVSWRGTLMIMMELIYTCLSMTGMKMLIITNMTNIGQELLAVAILIIILLQN